MAVMDDCGAAQPVVRGRREDKSGHLGMSLEQRLALEEGAHACHVAGGLTPMGQPALCLVLGSRKL